MGEHGSVGPDWPGGLLKVSRRTAGEVELSWPDVALPPEEGAHFHVWEWRGGPDMTPFQLGEDHALVATRRVQPANEAWQAWRIAVSDCGENEATAFHP